MVKVPVLRSDSAMTWCQWPSLTAVWLVRLGRVEADGCWDGVRGLAGVRTDEGGTASGAARPSRIVLVAKVMPPASLTLRAKPVSAIFWISVASFVPGEVLK